MRLLYLLSLIILLVPSLATLAAQVPHDGPKEIDTVVALEARDEPTNTTTTAPTSDTQTTATATTTSNSTWTSSTTQTPASTTIASLNASNSSDGKCGVTSKVTWLLFMLIPVSYEDHKSTGSPKPGELPLKPSITPAMGVGGFILIIIGAILALIGIRNLWYRAFIHPRRRER